MDTLYLSRRGVPGRADDPVVAQFEYQRAVEGAAQEYAPGTVRRQGRRRPSLHKDVRFLACSCGVLLCRTRQYFGPTFLNRVTTDNFRAMTTLHRNCTLG